MIKKRNSNIYNLFKFINTRSNNSSDSHISEASIISRNMTAIQHMQNYQSSTQLNEFRSFYQPSNDNNFYHVTCRLVYYHQNSASLDDDNYDYEFFFQSYHITCKLISNSLILDILNKEIYGMDFDVNNLKRKNLLTSHQKLNLELSLKRDILFYLCIPEREMRSDSDGNTSTLHDNTAQLVSIVDSQNYRPFNDHISCENGVGNYAHHVSNLTEY
jgi:hypothetical protein